MDTKSREMKENTSRNKGVLFWIILAVFLIDLLTVTMILDEERWYYNSGIFILMLLLPLAVLMMTVRIKSDNGSVPLIYILDSVKTDILIIVNLLFVTFAILCINVIATYILNNYNYQYQSTAFVFFMFVVILPEIYVCVLSYLIVIRRLKNPVMRKQIWIVDFIKKTIAPGGVLRVIAHLAKQFVVRTKRNYESAYSYEKKSLIRVMIIVGLNIIGIVCLMATYSVLPVLLILLLDIIVYLSQNKFYSDVGEIVTEIQNLSDGGEVQPLAISETSPLYNAALNLERINDNLDLSVKRQIKSEQMKVDLITNVSHDLKTPLTSIIGYIDLLKKEELSPEAQDYISIISAKSEHLKEMIQDLFEISKATSGNAELVLEQLDVIKLLEQTLGDMEDRIEMSGRDIRTNFPEKPLYISGDGKKLYRVYQNLFENALKYSMENTRIYIEAIQYEQKIVTIVKNIAAYEMDFTSDKIVERFQRGDKNRTTEGHGLGLAIAKSFSEACGGQLDIEIDGDVFKAIIQYPIYRES